MDLYRRRPLVALTCLLDLLFVMVFVALMLQTSQGNKTAKAHDIHELENTISIQNQQISAAKYSIDQLKQELAEEIRKKIFLEKRAQHLVLENSSLKQVVSGYQEQNNTPSRNVVIQGKWKAEIKSGSSWIELGRWIVYKTTSGELEMAGISLTDFSSYTKRISNVMINGDLWTFNSNWPSGVAEFKLRRQSDGKYYGWSYLNGRKMGENRWTRIQE